MDNSVVGEGGLRGLNGNGNKYNKDRYKKLKFENFVKSKKIKIQCHFQIIFRLTALTVTCDSGVMLQNI